MTYLWCLKVCIVCPPGGIEQEDAGVLILDS